MALDDQNKPFTGIKEANDLERVRLKSSNANGRYSDDKGIHSENDPNSIT